MMRLPLPEIHLGSILVISVILSAPDLGQVGLIILLARGLGRDDLFLAYAAFLLAAITSYFLSAPLSTSAPPPW